MKLQQRTGAALVVALVVMAVVVLLAVAVKPVARETTDPTAESMPQHTSVVSVALSTPLLTQSASIAFQSDRDGDFEIYAMDTDGHNVIQLTRVLR